MTLEEDLQKAVEAKDKGNREVAALKARIVNGESLGDTIKDYLFVHYNTTEFPAVEEELKKLADQVNGHNGQQAMVLYTGQEVIRKGNGGCFGGGDWTRLKICDQELGVLNGELKLDLANGSIILPTQNYAQKGEGPHIWEVDHYSWKLKEGGIAIPGYHYAPLYFEESRRLARPEILVDDEVELYFSTDLSYFEEYLSSRSKDWKEHLLETSHRDVNGDYLDALNLLGVEVPARFKQKYDAQVQRNRDQVLEGIRSQKNAPQYLKQALELGLHKEEQTIQLEPGISMNLPEYLRTQCNKHGIKIPE